MKSRHLIVAVAAGLALAACDKDPKPTDEAAEVVEPQAEQTEPAAAEPTSQPVDDAATAEIEVVPLQHASMLLKHGDLVIAVDPVKGALDAAPGEEPKADLILVTDIHGDHLDAASVAALRKEGAPVVAPKAVADEAGEALPDPTVLANGESAELLDGKVKVEAVPMYNLQRKRPDNGELFHVKGRGNGYLVTLGGKRIYISGDTECIPEMKALEGVDMAFVCMNLPYTMPVEEAAECVKAFKPKVLYPYHHRDQDPTKLTELLKDVPQTKIEILKWYPQ